MILKPSYEDLKVIGYYIGRLTTALGFIMFIPLLTSLFFAEWNPAFDFTLGIFFCLTVGLILQTVCLTKRELWWGHGLVVASVSWLVAMFAGALPLFLSGHFGSYLDACFDAMSGFATTGLILIQDGDHLSNGLNMWRHLMMFLGGQGIVVIGLTLLMRGTGGAYRMYVGEAREEKIMPNVIQTARFIWYVSLTYLVVGTLTLFFVGLYEGMPPVRSLLHGLWIFMAAFDTGGFTPQSQNVLYYHSLLFEIVTVIFMILGMLNFGLHYVIWKGNRKEFFKNIEVISLAITIPATIILALVGLNKLGIYPEFWAMFRKGFYQVISGHTGTGYSTIYPKEFIHGWGGLSMFAVAIAMALGGGACSTCGGIKALRIGILFKTFALEIRKIFVPPSAVVVETFHHLKDRVLKDKYIRMGALIVIAYLLTYLFGTIAGMFYGYSLAEASFESISAAANVGLSCGVTSPSMPTSLKIIYIIQMWLGRLEFMSVFALIGFILVGIRGR